MFAQEKFSRRLCLHLLTTTALIVVGSPAADADPCNYLGNVCLVLQQGSTPPSSDQGAPGSAAPGPPGGPASPIDAEIDNPQGLNNSGLEGLYAPLSVISAGGDGLDGATGDSSGGGAGGAGGAGGNVTLNITAPNQQNPNGTSDGVDPAVFIGSLGGDAGGGASGSNDIGGQSGTGGAGGQITSTQLDGQWLANSIGDGIDIISGGGTGGNGGSYYDSQNSDGVNGGTGGVGNTVNVTLTGFYIGDSGAYVASAGGNGGTGGTGDTGVSDGQGGNGGSGGNANDVNVTLAAQGQLEASGTGGAGLWVQSVGGQGGVGGGGVNGGTGGSGGSAGNVVVEVDGTINTTAPSKPYGAPVPGVLAQSLGNVGGGGGHASDWSISPTGGNGGLGGTTGTVMLTGQNARITTGSGGGSGDLSPGVLVQSIGGMGGVGPDETGIFAVGGNGGNAADGNDVGATLTTSTVSTIGFSAGGIVAQSIGGGGGKGGDATTKEGVLVNMDIGGTGGDGGDAGSAQAANIQGYISTTGDHSPGITMQAVGGGGGSGGAAYGKVSSKLFGASISVGGDGGAGGQGGSVNPDNIENNSGRIYTAGSDSYGILAQSIGGGGGEGGASTAKAQVSGASDYPSFALALATGGKGGTAGDGDQVYTQTTGLITTTGNGSIGVLAQSIGGGGGAGGDADAAASATGGNIGLTASIAHGGSGGGGGNGDQSWAQNAGLIITRGESADGMLIQSIGGGGGNGGAGDAQATNGADNSLSVGLSIGGKAGGGGSGGNVKGDNSGSILTLGDGANGLVIQTIGGGGGRGGGAAASSSGTVSATVTLGGAGGDGGDTYYTAGNSEVNNSGSIVTFGADAGGIVAQSIGGGGGAGGKAGTSLGDQKNNKDGSNGSDATTASAIGGVQNDFTSNTNAMDNYRSLDQLLKTTNALLGNGTATVADAEDDADELDDTASSGGETDDDNQSSSIKLGVSIGGSGGAGGAAGALTVTNSGTVATMGKHSDAILAQSIGGGGGKGGAASTTKPSGDGDIDASVAIGGNGGNATSWNANNGGDVTVANSGEVYTVGALSSAIVAQSIGGGGGLGGSSSFAAGDDSDGYTSSAKVTLGGTSSVTNGIGETATVTSSGAIETRGHDAYGIIAQSVSGGGGIVKTLATNLDNQAGSGNGQDGSGNSSTSKQFALDVSLGADGKTISGTSGTVSVTTSQGGTITTYGDNAIGILAQSVAAGGGLALGGTPTGSTADDFLGSGTKQVDFGDGPGNNANVTVTVGANISTGGNSNTNTGMGAVGVFAQSVGGSGGIMGDIGHTMQLANMGRSKTSDYIGAGGSVSVTVNPGVTISTVQGNAPGIVAQSVGGGGGWITTSDNAFVGSAGGSGDGGAVTVTVDGTVDAQGPASAGIFAQSTGGGDNGGSGTGGTVTVNIGSASNPDAAVWGGNGFGGIAAAVYVKDGADDNTVYNYGVINTHQSKGYAFYADGKALTVENWGIITGNANMSSGSVVNEGSGTYIPLGTVSLGTGKLVNEGTLDLTHAGGATTLTGDYEGAKGSRIAADADFVGGTADRLDVSGNAELDGDIEVRPTTLVPGTVTILTAKGGIDAGDTLAAATMAKPFSFTTAVTSGADGDVLTVTPSANFIVDGLNSNQASVAKHLQQIWEGDHPEALGKGFAAIATLQDDDDYAPALDSLSSRQIGAIATARIESAWNFASSMQSCPTFAGASISLQENDCLWGRAIGGHVDQSANGSSIGFGIDEAALQIGGQRQISDGLFAIGGLSWEHTNLHGDQGNMSASGDTGMAGAGVKYQTGQFLASAMLDFGYGSFDTSRSMSIGSESFTAEGSPNAWNVGLHGRVAYEIPVGGLYVRPILDLDATYMKLDGYQESGASDFALAVSDSDSWIFAANPSLEVGTRFDLANGAMLHPFASVGAKFSSGNDWTVTERFQNADAADGSFTSRVDNPAMLATVSAGVTLLTKSNFDMTLQYNGGFGDGYIAQSGLFKLAWRF